MSRRKFRVCFKGGIFGSVVDFFGMYVLLVMIMWYEERDFGENKIW